MSNTPTAPGTIEDILALAQRILDRHPTLAPVLDELLDESNDCDRPIDMEHAKGCFYFHLEHPGLAESLMQLAYHARELGLGLSPMNDDWSEEPTVPA